MIAFTLASTLLGVHLCDAAQKRLRICIALEQLCRALEVEIGFRADAMPQLLEFLLKKQEFAVLSFLSAEQIKQRLPVDSLLSETENERLSQFLFSLGKSDLTSQKKLLEDFWAYMKQCEMHYSEKHSKQAGLYPAFGFFFGALISLLVI